MYIILEWGLGGVCRRSKRRVGWMELRARRFIGFCCRPHRDRRRHARGGYGELPAAQPCRRPHTPADRLQGPLWGLAGLPINVLSTGFADFSHFGEFAAWPPVLLRTQHLIIRSALAKLFRYRRKLAVRYQVKAHLVVNVYP